MATYVNNLRLKEITTGDEDGTWGNSTNTNLELIADALGFNTQASFSSDADVTTTVADGAADPARALYFKVTSGTSLSTTRTLTIAPNTVSRVMFIENATTGSQSINISQGSGANVTIANGKTALVYLDGAGSGAAVVLASPQVAVTQLTDVTSSAAELNLVDGSAADTVVNSKAVIYGSAGQIVANELDVDNIQIDANAVKSTNTNGNIQLFPNGTGFTELYGNTNAGAIRFNCESNSHGVTLKGPPHSAGATYSLELPNAVGSTGQFLKASDGSGKLAFDTVTQYSAPQLKSGNYTAAVGEFIVASAGSITITLPASPSAGDYVTIKDGTGAAETTSFTVGRNSSNIASSASDLTFDKNFAEITLVYINGTIGWSV